jgi:hypothetical protein
MRGRGEGTFQAARVVDVGSDRMSGVTVPGSFQFGRF